MATTTQRLVVHQDRIVRETITEERVDIKPEWFGQQFGSTIIRRCLGFMNGGSLDPSIGTIDLAMGHQGSGGDYVAYLVHLRTLKLDTYYGKSQTGGFIVPVYDALEGAVRLKLEWQPPFPMVFVCISGGAAARHEGWTPYLVVVDGRRLYVPPLPNLYDSGEMCIGRYNRSGLSSMDVLASTIKQMLIAPWNGDLLRDSERKFGFSQRMFRWKPDEKNKESFAQQPMDLGTGTWQDLCVKVGNEFLSEVIGV